MVTFELMYGGFTPEEIDKMGLDDIQTYMTLLPARKELERKLMASAVALAFGGK